MKIEKISDIYEVLKGYTRKKRFSSPDIIRFMDNF